MMNRRERRICPGLMSTQLAIQVQGMFCAQCAVKLERALTRNDGVLTASVNYASQRAIVVFEPTRMTPGDLVNVIRESGFEVPLNTTTVSVSDLVYTTQPRTVERVLRRTTGAVQVAAELAEGRITYATLSTESQQSAITTLSRLGFHIGTSRVDIAKRFLARVVILSAVAIVLIGIALLQLNNGESSTPRVVATLAALVTFGAGYPFFHRAALMLLYGELDSGIAVGLVSLLSFLTGLTFTLWNSPPRWDSAVWGGYLLSNGFTTAWFLLRAYCLWLNPKPRTGSSDDFLRPKPTNA